MAAKRSACSVMVLYALFTSLVAPVLVHVLTDNRKGSASPGPTPATQASDNGPWTHPIPVVEERIIVQGVGRTAEEAWYDAVGGALRTSTAALVDAATWARDGQSICAAVLRDTRGLVSRYQELGCVCDRGVWRREVAVFVSRAALADRLRGTGVAVAGVPSSEPAWSAGGGPVGTGGPMQ